MGKTNVSLSLWQMSFDCPEDLKQMRLMTDQDMGGKSTAEFVYDEQQQCAVFKGNLDLTPGRPNVQNSGFAALVSSGRLGPWNLEDYNAIMVRAKTDGRIYVTNVRAPSVIEDDMFQAYTIGTEGEFCDIVLPFSDFIATHRGFIEGQIELDSRLIETVGVLMAQRRAGPFRLELKSISAVNTDLWDFPGKRWTGVPDDKRKE